MKDELTYADAYNAQRDLCARIGMTVIKANAAIERMEANMPQLNRVGRIRQAAKIAATRDHAMSIPA